MGEGDLLDGARAAVALQELDAFDGLREQLRNQVVRLHDHRPEQPRRRHRADELLTVTNRTATRHFYF